MALSKLKLGIQFPIQCQLCEHDPKITWKCLECDLLMCMECKNNIHSKIKTAGEHRIIATKDIGRTLGSSKDCTNVQLTVVEEYQTKIKDVSQLAISLDDSVWIGDGDRKKGMRLFTSHTGLQKVKCEGNKLNVISSFNTDILNMAITPGNDLLIATEGPILQKIKSGTKTIVSTVYDVESYQPVCIHVTRQNKVIVGTILNEKKGMVIVMDHKGNHEKVYGEDQTKGISFTFPFRITGTNNENIFVVDTMNDQCEGRVVVVGHEDIMYTYCGHSVVNTEDRPFTPSDLTATPSDNVIVVDCKSCTLHILNSSGQLITYTSTKDIGILKNPVSIGLTMVGQFCMLYLGTINKDESKDKAKLYKLNLVGC